MTTEQRVQTACRLLLVALSVGVANPVLASTIVGRVFEGGAPAGYANVVVLETRRGAQSDANGHFRIDNVPPGRWRIRTSLPGYPEREFAVSVPDTGSIDIGYIHMATGDWARPDGPVLEYFTPAIAPRIARGRLVDVVRVTEGVPVERTRTDSLGADWATRFFALLADTSAYRTFPGTTRKLCSFNEDVRVQLEDYPGILELRFCFGCSDLQVYGGGRGNLRDFGPLRADFLELMVEAFPEDGGLRDHLAKSRDPGTPPPDPVVPRRPGK